MPRLADGTADRGPIAYWPPANGPASRAKVRATRSYVKRPPVKGGSHAPPRSVVPGGAGRVGRRLSPGPQHDCASAPDTGVVPHRRRSAADRFLREIRGTASLHHPHILPLFDSGRAGGRLYYVLPRKRRVLHRPARF